MMIYILQLGHTLKICWHFTFFDEQAENIVSNDFVSV